MKSRHISFSYYLIFTNVEFKILTFLHLMSENLNLILVAVLLVALRSTAINRSSSLGSSRLLLPSSSSSTVGSSSVYQQYCWQQYGLLLPTVAVLIAIRSTVQQQQYCCQQYGLLLPTVLVLLIAPVLPTVAQQHTSTVVLVLVLRYRTVALVLLFSLVPDSMTGEQF